MVTIEIKENSQQAKDLIKFLKSLSFVEVYEEPRYNAETEKAIRDARAGKGLIQTTDHENLMKKLRS